MNDYTTLNEIYSKIMEDVGELNGDWLHNTSINRGIIVNTNTREELIYTHTNRGEFSVDGYITWKKIEHLIPVIIDEFTRNYPTVNYSPISKYFNPLVIRNGLSVNHCHVNIIKNQINNYKKISTCNSILEIGAGYGALAREILLENNNLKYVIIDLPESLLCSYSYLSLEFPNKKHVILSDSDDLSLNFDILYIPLKTLELFIQSKLITTFDIFINTFSLGEMTNKTIEKYYNLVTNILNVKSVFKINRFLVDDFSDGTRDNSCWIRIPRKWHIKHWEFEPVHLKCLYPIIQCKAVEMFSEINKTDDSIESSSIPKSNQLFHLWNAVRLMKTDDSINELITYLENINPNAEELWFYKNKKYIYED